ncbi:MAG: selenide, water dikinase SelD [Bacteroidales bacterium]|nr:selenide, water dikinase SelD [Bacteroidales bacterium]
MDIYLDYNATTPIDREVAEAMKPFIDHYFGNPSSMHQFGIEGKKAVEKARKQVADLIGCRPHEIVFTSGGTESNNYAIKGAAFACRDKGNHLITSEIEHPAVTEVCKYLEENGFSVTYLPVDEYGLVRMDELKDAIKTDTILITIMHANNEIGTIQPIEEIAQTAKARHILFHTDAAQSAGKITLNAKETGVDLLSIAGHKLYGPKGVGALYIREGVHLEKLIHGADHERNMRAGTENVIEIAGLGKACEAARRDLSKNAEIMKETRDMLHQQLEKNFPDIRLNGHPEKRLPNTLSVSFPNIEANILLNELSDRGIAASAGAACHTDNIDISAVLRAIGVEEQFAMGTLRFSTGKYTTREEISECAKIITKTLSRMNAGGESTEEETGKIKLTHYTQGMGCACKLRPQELEKLLSKIPVTDDPNILADTRTSDDAAVYKITEEVAIVQTLDFFTPIVNNGYDFGAIAAANALSDLYAMGAIPLFGLNIVGFPSKRLPISLLQEILEGAREKAREAGINILGGHTVDDHEPKYGMVVTGRVHPEKIWRNSGSREGDSLILTKPIGTGILATALKKGLANEEVQRKLTGYMTALNKKTAEIIRNYPVHACTDVTGFGLLGHLSEMTAPEKIDAEIYADKIPVIDEVWEFAGGGIIPGGTRDNLNFLDNKTSWDDRISQTEQYILCDAQTSGGLLFAVPEQYEEQIISDLHQAGIKYAAKIGRFTKFDTGIITIKKDL